MKTCHKTTIYDTETMSRLCTSRQRAGAQKVGACPCLKAELQYFEVFSNSEFYNKSTTKGNKQSLKLNVSTYLVKREGDGWS